LADLHTFFDKSALMKQYLKPRPTIEDVAAKAGLSVSTVSLVLNNKSNVSDETRARVNSVISALNYHPQRSARGLATHSSGNIGFILTDEHFSSAEPFYTRIFLGTEVEARNHSYYVLLTTVADTVSGTKMLPRFFLEHNVDGVIIAGKIGSSWIEYVREKNLPLLLIDYEVANQRVSSVTMDNHEGGRLAVEHFLKLGHTKIGFIGGDIKHPSIAGRYNAYRETLDARGIKVSPSWVSIEEPSPRFENGYRAAKQILSNKTTRPTAIFAANDALALGCMYYCKQAGLAIPESLAVMGFDNVESGLQSQPRLTTINVHREEMGGIAVRRLVEMITKESTVVERITTPVELVIRDSCGGKSGEDSSSFAELELKQAEVISAE
jgi:LacI family transcriptional regulator